ncbi:hypothetical protein BBJ28_00001781 [Nothophytophthora sp. Chile5]|nr:hypothetical protein BBJ28_00001781 [Nothophytophthora sp. Chile5]
MADASSSKRGAEQMAKEAQKKRRKEAKAAAMDGGQWERCMFKVARKNRYCNISRVPGSKFCGNHLPEGDQTSSKKSQKFKAACRRRVPCPVDGAHTVYEYDLAKHVLVCNRVKDADVMKSLPYYVENINSGTHCTSKTATTGSLGPTDARPDLEDGAQSEGKEEHSAPTAQQQHGIIDKLVRYCASTRVDDILVGFDLSSVWTVQLAIDFAELRKRIDISYDACVGDLALEKLHHKCCDQLLVEKKAAGASKSVLRHIDQQASIIGHMEQVKLLQDPGAAFVELGAGRGMLSLALAQTFPDSLFVLVDRAHTRGKADRFIGSDLKDSATGKQETKTLRAKIDIRHLNFAGMKELTDKSVVCMSKHLCGVATDLSLRAIAQTLPQPSRADTNNVAPAQSAPPSPSISTCFQGLAIALCCHHVCAWEDYVNPAFFLAQGFQPQEFELLTSMTSWTTCGMGLEGDAVEHILGISKTDRAALGRKCKRIIDAGRAAYLNQLQMKTRLVHYCDISDSLENCLLLAWR